MPSSSTAQIIISRWEYYSNQGGNRATDTPRNLEKRI